MTYLAVGIGGIIGALLRYWLGVSIHVVWSSPFPLGTLIINYLGCLVLGWFTTWVSRSDSFPVWLRVGFGTGVVGSFTTFSTFSIETVELMQRDLLGTSLLYVFLSFLGGLLMAWSGLRLASVQLRKRVKEGVETS